MKRLEGEEEMIFSIDAKKAFDKIQYTFLLIFSRVKERDILN